MAQYHELLQSQGKYCGWLTLDDTDDVPIQFLTYLIAALDSTKLIPKDILDAAFNGFHDLDENEALSLIINCLSGMQTPLYIIIDDYHLLPTGNTQQLVQLTFENIHFIISSREFPTALKDRLQISGSYFELTTNDLAFKQEETRKLLNLSKPITVTGELVNLPHQKTEGWVAAIEFARTWLARNTEIDINSFISQRTSVPS